MVEARHVRFRLSELVQAATKQSRADKVLNSAEALSYYWNWARSRGWRLIATTAQINPTHTHRVLERGDQFEMGAEEHWNVIWEGEDIDGCPDLVAESGLAKLSFHTRALYLELYHRGWREGIHALHREDSRIPMEHVIELADSDEYRYYTTEDLAEHAERMFAEDVDS